MVSAAAPAAAAASLALAEEWPNLNKINTFEHFSKLFFHCTHSCSPRPNTNAIY
jgi:hypothetical protein